MKKKCKKLGALLLAGAMGCQHSGLHATSKPQESTGEQKCAGQ